MRKRLFRDLHAVISLTRSRRASIENAFHDGTLLLGPSPRQVRKGAAAFDSLIKDVAWLNQEFAWVEQRTRDNADPNWTFEERLRGRQIFSLIGELQASVAEYFEIMPPDEDTKEMIAIGAADEDPPEKKWLDASLKRILELASNRDRRRAALKPE